MKVELTEKEIRTVIEALEDKATGIKLVVKATRMTEGLSMSEEKELNNMLNKADELMNLSKQIYYSSIGKGDA